MTDAWTRRQTLQGAALTGAGTAVAALIGAEEAAAATSPATVATLRRHLLDRGPLPLERLTDFDDPADADNVMTRGFEDMAQPRVLLDLPFDWVDPPIRNRSWEYSLHAWMWMGPVLAAFETTGERRYLDWCLDRGLSWARAFTTGTGAGTMAWYDMSLGLRAYRLAYLTEAAVRQEADPDQIDLLLACVARHQRELENPRAFAPTNHGFYVAAGQLAFARRLRPLAGMTETYALGTSRMRNISLKQFGPDGGHQEHSPAYHRMVLQSFGAAVNAKLITDAEISRRLRVAEEVLGWLVQPNGELVGVGDTSAVQVRSASAVSTSPTTRFLLTEGRRGVPAKTQMRVLPQTGYAIVRSPQPVATDDHLKSSYLFLNAGYHSNTHKHADDLALTWFDQEREILIDAGKYGYLHKQLPAGDPQRKLGYMYSAPERQHVESTAAHNTVGCDGRDHVRYGRRPFGSALAGATERSGHFRLQAVVDHGAWRHRRDIVLRPGRWLLVTDTVDALDGKGHDFRVWWHFPSDLRPKADTSSRLVIDWPDSSRRLWVSELGRSRAINPASGQRGPLRGWRSRTDLAFTPAWSTGFQALGVRRHTFRTLFHFGAEPRTAAFPDPF